MMYFGGFKGFVFGKSLKTWNPSIETIPLLSTGLPNGKAVVRSWCSANAFEPKNLNMIRNPLLAAKAVDCQPAMSCSEMRCKDLDMQPEFRVV